jgi:hypothetical protein
LTTSNGTTAISGDHAVVAAYDEAAARIKDILECISAIKADLQHAAIEAQIGIHVRCFKVEVLLEGQLRSNCGEREGQRVEPFVTCHLRIIDESGVRQRICRWNGYSRI